MDPFEISTWRRILDGLGAFPSFGKSSLSVIVGTQDSAKYTLVLQNYSLPSGNTHSNIGWEFQQDKTPIRTSKVT